MHAGPPKTRQAWISFGLLLACLVAFVGLAKNLSPPIEHAVGAANAPRTVVGIVIATLVLLPQTCAPVRAARANRLQSSMNLAIGSALAGIGLTVPLSWATSRLSKGHQQSPTAVRERPVATAQWTASRLPPPPNCQLPP